MLTKNTDKMGFRKTLKSLHSMHFSHLLVQSFYKNQGHRFWLKARIRFRDMLFYSCLAVVPLNQDWALRVHTTSISVQDDISHLSLTDIQQDCRHRCTPMRSSCCRIHDRHIGRRQGRQSRTELYPVVTLQTMHKYSQAAVSSQGKYY